MVEDKPAKMVTKTLSFRSKLVMAVCCNTLFLKMKRFLYNSFYAFGVQVGLHPIAFSVTPLLLLSAMGMGMLVIDAEDDTERLFTPISARIFGDRQKMRDLFPDTTSWNFDAFGLVDVPSQAVMIFKLRGPGEGGPSKGNILDTKYSDHILSVSDRVKQMTTVYGDTEYNFTDLCAVYASGECAMDGIQFLDGRLATGVRLGMVTYPNMQYGKTSIDLSLNLGNVAVRNASGKRDGVLLRAGAIKIRYYWRVDRKEASMSFNREFLDLMREEEERLPSDMDMAYSSSESLEVELEEGTRGDAIYFGLTILSMCFYSVLVTAGGDAVSTRALLAFGGVLAAVLGIVGSMGFLSLIGFRFVNFVGIMPFLVLGIGVDDMFLLLSAWGESVHEVGLDVPGRVGVTFAKAGVGITITSLTDFIAFMIGFFSEFIAVRHFCVYTGVAVLLCYFANATFFGACLTGHGRRVYSGHHWLTCKPTKSRQTFRDEGAGCCRVYCCGGSVPRAGDMTDEGLIEKIPRKVLPPLIMKPMFKLLLGGAYVCYLYFAIRGALDLQTGMKYIDLVLKSSYYYKFSDWDMHIFGQRLAMAFAVDETVDYSGETGTEFLKALDKARKDPDVDPTFERCWLSAYRKSSYYQSGSLFIDGLKVFLEDKDFVKFKNDVIFDKNKKVITSSRCYVLSENVVDPFEQADIMKRLRKIADEWPNPSMFVYQPIFVMLEHTLAVLPQTIMNMGTAVLVMFLVTFAFLPQPLMVTLVTLNILSILVGVFGSMYYLDINFSGMSMIHLLMSIGFSVDFSAHICAAYLMSDARTREERAVYAIVHAAGPIFNGGTSSLLGVSLLLLSESYFFQSFFKVMAVVIISGALHAVFLMPVVLSFIGPENTHIPINAVAPTNNHNANTNENAPQTTGITLSSTAGDPLPDVLSSVPPGIEEQGDKETSKINDNVNNCNAFALWSDHSVGDLSQVRCYPKNTWAAPNAPRRQKPLGLLLHRAILEDISLSGELGASQAYTKEVEFPFPRSQERVDSRADSVWDPDDLSLKEGLGASQSYAKQAVRK